jgi:hypothetical protein
VTIPRLEFPPFRLLPEAEALREQVCLFLEETLPKVKAEDRFASWTTPCPASARRGACTTLPRHTVAVTATAVALGHGYRRGATAARNR